VLELIQIFLNHVRLEGELGLPEVGDAGDPVVFEVRVGFFFNESTRLEISLVRRFLCRSVCASAESGDAQSGEGGGLVTCYFSCHIPMGIHKVTEYVLFVFTRRNSN